MKMLSLKPHVYAGRRLKTDEEFECRGQSDRRLLIALGRAKDAPVVAALLKATPMKNVADVDAPAEMTFSQDTPAFVEWPTAEQLAPAERAWGEYEAAAVVAEVSPRTGKPKRTYKRRDMVAE
jgi:hypothetical protein